MHDRAASSAFLIYDGYLLPDGSRPRIGGIQTYIQHLAALLSGRGVDAVVVQPGDRAFDVVDGGLRVIGIEQLPGAAGARLARALYDEAMRRANPECDYLIFCTDSLAVPTRLRRAIAIQHGVSWDIPLDVLPQRDLGRRLSSRFESLGALRKAYQAYKSRRAFERVPTCVCVDYNFPNWLRTVSGRAADASIHVIPNCVFPQGAPPLPRAAPKDEPASAPLRIVYARRFETYRGTRLMAEAIERLAATGLPIAVTFAGEGPDREHLRQRFARTPWVSFATYLPRDSVAFHAEFDVAVVPSLASEGTTLAVLEAMAAGCAVVATPIGGITNLIIDGFNGMLVPPTPAALASALARLAKSPALRRDLAAHAQLTARGPFSFDVWQRRWNELIDSLA